MGNNSIKGSFKDPIINDFVYFASNGLKKMLFLEKMKSKLKGLLITLFLIFNIYPQKYNSDLVNNESKMQNLLNHNYKDFQKNKTINTFFSQNLRELNNDDNNNFLI